MEPKEMEPKELAELIAKTLDDKKGIDVALINIAERSSFADYFVLVSAGIGPGGQRPGCAGPAGSRGGRTGAFGNLPEERRRKKQANLDSDGLQRRHCERHDTGREREIQSGENLGRL